MKKSKLAFLKVLSLAVVATLILPTVPAVFAATEGKTISILGTSDLHGNIWGFSYEDNKETTNNGMARVYSYVKEVRSENPNTILVDAGDTIQGTILTDDIYNKQTTGEHPIMTAMNFMNYDAWVLGNHEFNFGIPTLQRIMEQSDAPVLAANAKFKSGGALLTGKSWTMVERDGVKVAIIGITNPNIPTWDGEKVDALSFGAVSDSVATAIKEINGQADIIMVSVHTGVYAEFDEENGSDSAQKIIDDNPEVDIVQVAHNHVVVQENPTTGALIGGVRNSGRDVARFDITLDANNNITSKSVEIVDMANYEPSQEIRDLAIVKESHEKTIEFIQGSTADGESGGNVLGTTTAKFQPADEIKGIPEGKLQDTAVMDLINKIQLENSGADVSAAALFKDTSDLPEGTINYGNIFNIYKFDNTLYRVEVTGAELKAYMEWSAECYNQWQPGDLSISFDPDYPGYLYDMFAGVDYEIDLSQPKGSRIKNVMFKGAPLKDDQTLTLAVNNYRYASALKSGGLVANKKEWESSNSIRDMIVQYFATNSPVEPTVDHNWKIVGVDLQLENPERATLVNLVNAGQIDSPYDKSLRADDYTNVLAMANNVSVNGSLHTAQTQKLSGETYYRLRDLAMAFNATSFAFDIQYDNGVVINKGVSYIGNGALLSTTTTGGRSATLNAKVGETMKTVPTVYYEGYNYISSNALNSLLGIHSEMADGVLMVK